jgi:inosine-uridine nucleoside N-ribohydrolase
MRHDVWIDTDTAIGVEGADVDDGLALVQAFNSPELVLHGVSAVFGNAPLAQTFPIAVEVVAGFGPRGLPVARGAASAGELGEPNDAVAAMASALSAQPLTIVAIGPLTNVGSLLLRHRALADRIEAIVCVAGRRPGQVFRSVPTQREPFPDLNFECDPEAMRIVLDSGVPLVLAPWEVSSGVWIEPDDLERLARRGEAARWLAERSGPWLALWRRDFGAHGFNPFDSLAVAWLTHPELLEHFAARVWIEDGPDDRPAHRGEIKPYLLVEESTAAPRAVYCHRARPALKAMLLERLGGGLA